jgi:flavodoxin
MKTKKIILISGFSILLIFVFLFYSFALPSAESSSTQSSTDKKKLITEVTGKKDKVLVAFFSHPEPDGVDAVANASRVIVEGTIYGNTHYVAEIISKATGGDLHEIKTAHSYPTPQQSLLDYAKKEIDNNERPKLISKIDNLKDYDVVFIGFPNWWYDMPMPIYTFFDEYDFSGKTIIPFCTHGGSRFSKAQETILDLEKGAQVVRGLSVSRNDVSKSKNDVLSWLSRIGMNK